MWTAMPVRNQKNHVGCELAITIQLIISSCFTIMFGYRQSEGSSKGLSIRYPTADSVD